MLLFRRKDVTSQVSDKVTPDSQKSTTQKMSETASGMTDKAAGAVQGGEYMLASAL